MPSIHLSLLPVHPCTYVYSVQIFCAYCTTPHVSVLLLNALISLRQFVFPVLWVSIFLPSRLNLNEKAAIHSISLCQVRPPPWKLIRSVIIGDISVLGMLLGGGGERILMKAGEFLQKEKGRDNRQHEGQEPSSEAVQDVYLYNLVL